jgi:tripartite-type tricarboxylate transporter receptor subunit TctC
MLINTSDMLVIPHLRKLTYDALNSFEPIVVNSASPYRLLADLFDAARAKPSVLTLAGVGPASVFDISAEMLKRAAHVNMTYVPYPAALPSSTRCWVSM